MAKREEAEILEALQLLDVHNVRLCLEAARRIEQSAASDKHSALKRSAFMKLIDVLEML